MSTRTRWIRRRALAVAVAAVGVVAIAGTALAGHQTSGVKSYTGCLVSGDGVITPPDVRTPRSLRYEKAARKAAFSCVRFVTARRNRST